MVIQHNSLVVKPEDEDVVVRRRWLTRHEVPLDRVLVMPDPAVL